MGFDDSQAVDSLEVETNDNKFQRISLGWFTRTHPIRYFCIRIITWKWFDRFIVSSVIFNTVILGLTDYTDAWADGPNGNIWINSFIDKCNGVSFYIFLVEAILKIIAMGFCTGKQSYLSEGWNRLDFVIVISGIMSLLNIKGVKVGYIRVLRVMRPLRTLHSLPGLKVLTNSLLASLPALGNVFILLMFCTLVFSVLGMEMYRGAFHYRCRITPFPVSLPPNGTLNYPPNSSYIGLVQASPFDYICKQENGIPMTLNDTTWTIQDCFWPVDPLELAPKLCNPYSTVGRQCGNGLVCGSNYDNEGNPRFNYMLTTPWNISTNDDAVFNSNLNFGFTNFDNLGRSSIMILQTLTGSGWMGLTQMAQSTGSPIVGGIYFTVLLYVGMCFILQLNMAVLFSEFERAKEEQAKLLQNERDRISRLLVTQRPTSKKAQRISAVGVQLVKRITSKALEQGDIVIKSAIGRRYQRFQLKIHRIVTSKMFINFGLFVTVTNIIILALDHHDIDLETKIIYEEANFTFMIYFGLESLLKIIGLGFRRFWIDKFNRFDLLTFFLGVTEVSIHPPTFIDGTPGGGGFFTAFRAARAFKLARMWKSLNQLLTAILASFSEILNFLLFLVLFLLIFSLVGMELFATKYQFDPNNFAVPFNNTNPQTRLHRSNFDSIHWAFFTVFQILTYDDFPSVMYDGWISVGTITPIYFAVVIILGVLIVMNMFSAILVQSVMVDKGDEIILTNEKINNQIDQVIPINLTNNSKNERRINISTSRHGTVTPQRIRVTRRALQQLARIYNTTKSPQEKNLNNPRIIEINSGKTLKLFSNNNLIRQFCTFLLKRKEYTWIMSLIIFISCVCTALDTPLQDTTNGIGMILDQSNHFFAILFSIEFLFNIISRGFYYGNDAYMKDSWRLLDGFIVFVSILPYFLGNAKSGALSSLRSLRAFRALRPLRVINKLPSLKLVVNTLFRCIPDMGRALLFAFFMLFLFGLMALALFKGSLNTCSVSPYNYGLGTGIPIDPPWFPIDYNGDYNLIQLNDLKSIDIMTFPKSWSNMSKNQRISLKPVWNRTGCGPFHDNYIPTSRDICLCYSERNGTSWIRQTPQNFDNIFNSVSGLFELTTMEGWIAVAIACIDAVGENMQPIMNYNPAIMIYWWFYMIICAFFITNLFIGVLCDSFQRESYGSMVTDEQVRWIKLQKKVLAMSPIRTYPYPSNYLRRICFKIIKLKFFEHFITIIILINTISMAVQGFGQSKEIEMIYNLMNFIFSIVFTFEAIIKIGSYSYFYFQDGWNRFDFIIVLFTIVSFILQGVDINVGSTATVVRVFRVGRALRLIKKAKIMKNLFDTLIVSLPAVGNVVSLLMLLYYIFAAVAVQLFAKVGFDGDMINEDQNFQNFWVAFQTLIGFSTGENWDNFMWEVYNQMPTTNPTCIDRQYDNTMCGFNNSPGCIPLDGCGSGLIIPFMYFFFLIMGYIGINLFSGIVVDAIGDSSSDCPVNVNTLTEFTDRWAQFDPSGSGLITADELTDFLYTVYPPFGFKGVPGFTRRRVVIAIGELDIPIYDKKYVHFKDVPRALVQRVLAEGDKSKYAEITHVMEKLGINKQFDEMWFRNHGKRHQNNLTNRAKDPLKQYAASVVIQRFFARLKLERKNNDLTILNSIVGISKPQQDSDKSMKDMNHIKTNQTSSATKLYEEHPHFVVHRSNQQHIDGEDP